MQQYNKTSINTFSCNCTVQCSDSVQTCACHAVVPLLILVPPQFAEGVTQIVGGNGGRDCGPI
eukprot:11220421-Lingulodinium_polyedra.AAC.1